MRTCVVSLFLYYRPHLSIPACSNGGLPGSLFHFLNVYLVDSSTDPSLWVCDHSPSGRLSCHRRNICAFLRCYTSPSASLRHQYRYQTSHLCSFEPVESDVLSYPVDLSYPCLKMVLLWLLTCPRSSSRLYINTGGPTHSAVFRTKPTTTLLSVVFIAGSSEHIHQREVVFMVINEVLTQRYCSPETSSFSLL